MNDVDLWIELSRRLADAEQLVSKLSVERDKVLIRLQNKGLTQTEMAEVLDVTRQRISQMLKRGKERA